MNPPSVAGLNRHSLSLAIGNALFSLIVHHDLKSLSNSIEQLQDQPTNTMFWTL
ncbi:hypothetical protein V6Z12_A02G178400 [Gossypium hirsutum]